MNNLETHCTITGFGDKNQLERCFNYIMMNFENLFNSEKITIDFDSFDYFTKYDESYSGIRFVGYVMAENSDLFFNKPLELISEGFKEVMLLLTTYNPHHNNQLNTEPLQTYFFINGTLKMVDKINNKYLKKALRRVAIEKQNAGKEYPEKLLEELESYLLQDMQNILDNNSFLKQMGKKQDNNRNEIFKLSTGIELGDPLGTFPDPNQRKLFS